MLKNLSNTTLYLIIAGIILILLIVVGYFIYLAGKRKSSIDLSDPSASGDTPKISEVEVRQLTENLYSDMEGVNFFGHNMDTWKRFLSLNDADMIRVYNEFDMKYQKESGQSLVQWVKNESTTGIGDWATIQSIVQQRFAKLKLI